MSGVIRFSHHYEKLKLALGEDKSATLLEVIPVNVEKLSLPFIKYDTDNGMYPLPKKGKMLILILRGAHGIFTTIRSAKPGHGNLQDKETYYRGFIGKTLDVEITPSNHVRPV